MKRKIIDCISIIDEFKVQDYMDLNIGVEIQDFVEPNLTDDEIDRTIKGYKELFKGFRNIKAMHGPFLDLKPASPDKDIRRVSQEKYFNALNIAKDLDIDYVIFHSQMNPLLNEPKIMDLNHRQSADFFNYLMRETSYEGIVLIENIFESSPSDMLRLMEKIESDRIKLNLDLGHSKLSGKPMEDWIKELKDHMVYIHFHSNNGRYDEHRRPTDNEIEELKSLLDKYKLEPVISLEYRKINLKEEIERFRR